MTIQSMTGFSRVEDGDETSSWIWELRSVNGKSLDLRFRLPSGLEKAEAEMKTIAGKYVKRGNIQISLNIDKQTAVAVPTLNEASFDAAVKIVMQASQRSGLDMPTLDSILAMKGVIDLQDEIEDEAAIDVRTRKLVESFEAAIKSLAEARSVEGTSIGKVLLEQVDRIEVLKNVIKSDPSRSAEAVRARLAEQLSRLVDQSAAVDPQRLHQEAAILATKADLQEELDRLEAHVDSARELLGSSDPIGRKLDFLSQEFNRECNTICSKSNAPAVTTAGLEMKVVIDQFREQVQNVQ
ncbi:MAG: YicC/YloC family endoribonuclease [Salaquimonas sp.]